jgi:chromosome segregation ATPase
VTAWEQVLAAVFDLGQRHERLHADLQAINERLDKIMSDQSADQQQIDSDVSGIEDALGEINTLEQANGTAVAAVAAAFAAFQANQTPDNLSALDQAVTDAQTAAGNVSAGVSAVQALVPASPAPAPSPSPSPSAG